MVRIKKIKASTILETVVALVIILAIFSIATSIFINTAKVSVSIQKIKAREFLKVYAQKTKDEKLFYDEEQKEEDLIVKRELISNYKETSLITFRFSVYDINEVELASWNEQVNP